MTATVTPVFACIVVAAGNGSRFGEPKAGALLPSGERFLDAIIRAAAEAGAHPIVAVVPPEVEVPAGTRSVTNRDGRGEQIVSVRLGLMQLVNTTAGAALLWPVDHPFVESRTVLAILDVYRRTGAHIVVPAFQGRRGHPALFDRAVWRELMTVESGGARTVVRAHGDSVREVPVNDPGITKDIDTRSDMPPSGWRESDAIS